MSEHIEGLKAAAIGILREKFHELDNAALRGQAVAIYVNSTPTPNSAHEVVKITEAVLKDHTLAVAIFNVNEAKRLKAALIKAEATP